MKKLFYAGMILLAVFEILKVYFIMPMPGSQEIQSLDIAYFLHSYRWWFRVAFGLMIIAGFRDAFQVKHRWVPAAVGALAMVVVYYFNFKMTADAIFSQPEKVTFKPQGESLVNDSSLVIAVEYKGVAKAYPIRYLSYHHQVQDTIAGKNIIVTYCNVCRTGRVFEPTVNGQHEKFRLVGMDHFNAMFEDATTKSWWRQATGEAVAGTLKGQSLPEVESFQTNLRKFFELYPHAVVMQLDAASRRKYDSTGRFEKGKSKGKLTRTDSLSWKDKSWVVGIQAGNASKAYDWIQLTEKRIINDNVGGKPVVLALSGDAQTFVVFERPSQTDEFTLRQDTLFAAGKPYDLTGRDLSTPGQRLERVKSYQEFWHSWRTFHPDTEKFE